MIIRTEQFLNFIKIIRIIIFKVLGAQLNKLLNIKKNVKTETLNV